MDAQTSSWVTTSYQLDNKWVMSLAENPTSLIIRQNLLNLIDIFIDISVYVNVVFIIIKIALTFFTAHR